MRHRTGRLLAPLLLGLACVVGSAVPAPAQLGSAPEPPGAARAPGSLVPGAHREPNAAAAQELEASRRLLAEGNFEEAVEAGERAARADSLSDVVFGALGVAYQAAGRPHDAFRAFRRASVLDPGSVWALNRAGQVLLSQLGRPAGAVAAFRQALSIQPDYAPAHYSLSVYHQLRGEIEQTEQEAQQAFELARSEEEQAVFFGLRMQILLLRGEYQAADDALRGHIFSRPDDYRAQQARALALRLLGRDEEARDLLEDLLARLRPQAVLLNDLAMVQRALGRADSAEAAFRQAWDLDAGAGEAGYNLALARLAAADTGAALMWLGRVEERAPGWYGTAYLAARIHRARGDLDKARLASLRAWALNPLSYLVEPPGSAAGRSAAPAESLLVRAERALLAGDFGLAVQLGHQACLDPGVRPRALFFVFWANRLSGLTPGGGVAQMEAALEGLPASAATERAVAERELGILHRRLGNPDDARAHLERAVAEKVPERALTAPAAAALLDLYLEAGEPGAARRLAARVSESEDAGLLAALARAAAAAGDEARARTLRERARAAEFLPS